VILKKSNRPIGNFGGFAADKIDVKFGYQIWLSLHSRS